MNSSPAKVCANGLASSDASPAGVDADDTKRVQRALGKAFAEADNIQARAASIQ